MDTWSICEQNSNAYRSCVQAFVALGPGMALPGGFSFTIFQLTFPGFPFRQRSRFGIHQHKTAMQQIGNHNSMDTQTTLRVLELTTTTSFSSLLLRSVQQTIDVNTPIRIVHPTMSHYAHSLFISIQSQTPAKLLYTLVETCVLVMYLQTRRVCRNVGPTNFYKKERSAFLWP
jgi:hypothetical protein